MRQLPAFGIAAALTVLAAALVWARPQAEAQAPQVPPDGAPGLHRIALYPTPDLAPAEGEARLRWDPSPFGASVTRDGSWRYRIGLEIRGLPDPASLGDYRTYVAWATTPVMDPVIALGEVGNGSFPDMGVVDFDKFVLLVSAEASPEVETRAGRLVLRGASPSTRILPDNHLMVPVSGSGEAGADAAGHEGMDHAAMGHGTPADTPGWPHPPMLPETPMIPGLGRLRPAPLPFLPRLATGEEVPEATPSRVVRLQDGQTLDLIARQVRRRIHGREYLMYGFNGQYPGPLIHVDQSATVFRELRESDTLADRGPLARPPSRQRL